MTPPIVETLSDLPNQHPEPSGFQIKHEGITYETVFPTYEQAEKSANKRGLRNWRFVPVYGKPNVEASILGEKTAWTWDGVSDTITVG